MRKRNLVRVRQSAEGLGDQAPPKGAPTAIQVLEPITWLALVGTVAAVYLTIAFPDFDPLAAVFGQFP